MSEKENVVIEPATEADLDELSEMLGELFAQESDFRPKTRFPLVKRLWI